MKQILIIEDDEINCLLYEHIIADNLTEIDFAYDGEEGLNKFKEKNYDLILLDLGLPKIDGLQVARLIKEHEAKQQIIRHTPIIVITANNIPGTQKLAMTAGVNEYLTKPFDIEKLRELVKFYLQKDTNSLCQAAIFQGLI